MASFLGFCAEVLAVTAALGLLTFIAWLVSSFCEMRAIAGEFHEAQRELSDLRYRVSNLEKKQGDA